MILPLLTKWKSKNHNSPKQILSADIAKNKQYLVQSNAHLRRDKQKIYQQ